MGDEVILRLTRKDYEDLKELLNNYKRDLTVFLDEPPHIVNHRRVLEDDAKCDYYLELLTKRE